MNRRAFLAATGLGLTATSAGCGLLEGPRRLAAPTEEVDADGREKHLVFRDDGQRVAAFTLAQRSIQGSAGDQFNLRLHLSHRSSPDRYDAPTTVDRFRFDLRTPPTTEHAPARIYVQVPRSELTEVLDFGQTDDGWNRIASEDPGDLGRGTINVETVVAPKGEMGDELEVRVAATLTESGFDGTTYELDARTTFAPVTR